MSQDTPSPRLGLFISQVDRSYAQTVEHFQLAESLGFDNAWLVDHLVAPSPPVERGCHEAWTLLAALAVATRRIGLGVLVSSNSLRHPALLIKQAVTVDHVSDGRLVLGMGTGWLEDEHARFGIELPGARERVDRFEEALAMIDTLMTTDRVTYHGRYYTLDDALLSPRPVHSRIPILIAAHRPRITGFAARHADIWDTYETVDGTATDGVSMSVPERMRLLDSSCDVLGRDRRSIRRSTFGYADALASEAAYREFVHEAHLTGFTDVTVVLPRRPDLAVLQRIADEVLPDLRLRRH